MRGILQNIGWTCLMLMGAATWYLASRNHQAHISAPILSYSAMAALAVYLAFFWLHRRCTRSRNGVQHDATHCDCEANEKTPQAGQDARAEATPADTPAANDEREADWIFFANAMPYFLFAMLDHNFHPTPEPRWYLWMNLAITLVVMVIVLRWAWLSNREFVARVHRWWRSRRASRADV